MILAMVCPLDSIDRENTTLQEEFMAERRAPAVGVISNTNFSQIFGMIVLIAWGVTWYWIQDQSTRMRAEERVSTEQGSSIKNLEKFSADHESRMKALEQSTTTQEATRNATASYAAEDRLLLKSVSAAVTKQDDKLQYVVNTVERMNEIVQILAKDQVALQRRLEADEDTLGQKRRMKVK